EIVALQVSLRVANTTHNPEFTCAKRATPCNSHPLVSSDRLRRNRRPPPPRQISMTATPGRPGRRLPALRTLALAAAAALTTPCGSHPAPAGVSAGVPAAFRHACGHPGAKVRVTRLPVTVKHSACNLTGVSITVRGGEGAVVPESGGVGATWD